MNFGKENFQIELKEGGAYFLVDYNDLDVKSKIMSIIKKYDIKGVDYIAIENALSKREKYVLISNDVENLSKNEKVEIVISEDALTATAKITPPLFHGNKLTKDVIVSILYQKGIIHGINFKEIDNFLEYRDYTKEYIFAKGTFPKPSIDGFIKLHIDTSQKMMPKILENGMLDYKSVKLFQDVRANTLLAEKIEGTVGEYGINVFGKEVLPELPKDAPDLPLGENTFIDDIGTKLYSSQSGRILYKDGKINVFTILTLENGVNTRTGNVKFSGNILINGDVLSGFIVESEGNIEINGTVEGATLISGGSVLITKGIQGSNIANVYSKKDIIVQFIENANVFAEENIFVNSILHSKVECGKHLKLIGKRAIIMGGTTIVGGDANVKYLGSSMSNNTAICVGVHPKVIKRYEELVEEIEENYKKYEKLEKIINIISKKGINSLNKETRQLFLNSIKEKMEIKKDLSNLKKDLSIIIPLFKKRVGTLKTTGCIFSGTKIIVNDATLFIKEDLGACIIKNIDGKAEVLNIY